MSVYLPNPSSETRDESFKRMRAGNLCDDDFTSEKPRHRRVAYICSIQLGAMTKEEAIAKEEKHSKPSEMILSVLARLARLDEESN